MSQYQIFILPLIAVVIVIFFPLFGRDVFLPDSWWSGRRRRIYLGRALVVALLLATLITILWPLANPNLIPLIQGAIVTAVLLLPLLLIHWVMSLRYAKHRTSSELIDDESTKQQHDYFKEKPASRRKSRRSRTTGFEDFEVESDNSVIAAPVSDASLDNVAASPPAAPDTSSMPASVERHEDTDTEIHEQMQRVSSLVQSFDLDGAEYASPDIENPDDRNKKDRDQQVANSLALTSSTDSSTSLENLSTPQITELVLTLRKDRGRLQKLVVAQQAAISSERQAHEETRTLTRDAIKIMRDARVSQKQAIKIARRERAERHRIEQHYKKVAHALRNAMSIIEKRKAADANQHRAPVAGTIGATDKVV